LRCPTGRRSEAATFTQADQLAPFFLHGYKFPMERLSFLIGPSGQLSTFYLIFLPFAHPSPCVSCSLSHAPKLSTSGTEHALPHTYPYFLIEGLLSPLNKKISSSIACRILISLHTAHHDRSTNPMHRARSRNSPPSNSTPAAVEDDNMQVALLRKGPTTQKIKSEKMKMRFFAIP